MILWNVAAKKIEGKYDGRVFEFAPNERKRIMEPDVYNHLIFKLRTRGLVMLDESDQTQESEKKALISGLKERWKILDFVVRNYQTMNKARESQKLAAEAPSDTVMDAAEEAADILEKLKTLEGERYQKVNAYLDDPRAKKIAASIEETKDTVETKGPFETEIKGKRPGRPRKDAHPLTANQN